KFTAPTTGGNSSLFDNGTSVGINTAAFAAATDRLTIAGGDLRLGVGAAPGQILWPTDPGGGAGDAAWIRYFVEAGENTKLQIGNNNDGDDDLSFFQFGAERMTIYNGNIGVGTPAPIYPFQAFSGAVTTTLYSENNNLASDGLYGVNSAAAGAGNGAGVVGITSQSALLAAGVWGQNNNAAGNGVIGVNAAAAGAGNGSGVFGATNQTPLAAGVWGQNANASGTGVVGAGNGIGASVLIPGSGGAFVGSVVGIYAKVTSGAPAQSIYTDEFGAIVRVNYWSGALQYKINGAGSVSTIVADPSDPEGQRQLTLHAPETPEIYFEDYGQAKLAHGFAHVEIDPLFVGNVTISEQHPLRVFIQLEDDEGTRGVVVKNKTTHGFDVVELGGGSSNLPFQWHIVCNRADEVMKSGRVSHNADARFEIVTDILDSVSSEAQREPLYRAGPTPTASPLLGPVNNGSSNDDWLRMLLPAMHASR
ncbi:MAG: hypothetical protein ABI193_12530, partial [Minicystis sp.]